MHSSRPSDGFLDSYGESAISSYGFLNVLEVFLWIPLGPVGASGHAYGFHSVFLEVRPMHSSKYSHGFSYSVWAPLSLPMGSSMSSRLSAGFL